jgi:hypothetical protein
MTEVISGVALLISIGALGVAFLSYRQSRKIRLLGTRREASASVRIALSDVAMHGRIAADTTDNIRDAWQISTLVFSNLACNTLRPISARNTISLRLIASVIC